MPVWDVPAKLWTLSRRVADLLELQEKSKMALETVEVRLRALENRMTHLEAGQGHVITEAKAAAGIAATGLASSVISKVVTRLTRVEMQLEAAKARQSSPPAIVGPPPPAGA